MELGEKMWGLNQSMTCKADARGTCRKGPRPEPRVLRLARRRLVLLKGSRSGVCGLSSYLLEN